MSNDLKIDYDEKIENKEEKIVIKERTFTKFKEFMVDVFNLNKDKASNDEIERTVKSGTAIKGTNMCILILAILVASIGLNMNSTAVIIGAMLISPLMGEIVGIGYGFATNNFRLAKRSMCELLFEVVICIITSTIYFTITPISTACNELLSRTNPTIWDVLIAFVGGAAGMIALTRKEKLATVIPGVSIATALMPPLCTAGYGIATLEIRYFLGAIYLFFINSFFICLGNFLVLQIIRVPKSKYLDEKENKKIRRNITVATIIMILPSVFLAYQIVNETVINNNFQKYLDNEFTYESTQIVKSNIDIEKQQIKVAVIGKTLEEDEIRYLSDKLGEYDLQGMNIEITQTEIPSGITKEEIDELIEKQLVSTNNSSILSKNSQEIENLKEEILSLKTKVIQLENINTDSKTITAEMKNKFSKVLNCEVKKEDLNITVNITISEDLTEAENLEIDNWIKKRFDDQTVTINKGK